MHRCRTPNVPLWRISFKVSHRFGKHWNVFYKKTGYKNSNEFMNSKSFFSLPAKTREYVERDI